jgi:predicted pyridoxine 5'-phosphate oxidase superfamily flavin-nucleotide-binding protein
MNEIQLLENLQNVCKTHPGSWPVKSMCERLIRQYSAQNWTLPVVLVISQNEYDTFCSPPNLVCIDNILKKSGVTGFARVGVGGGPKEKGSRVYEHYFTLDNGT